MKFGMREWDEPRVEDEGARQKSWKTSILVIGERMKSLTDVCVVKWSMLDGVLDFFQCPIDLDTPLPAFLLSKS